MVKDPSGLLTKYTKSPGKKFIKNTCVKKFTNTYNRVVKKNEKCTYSWVCKMEATIFDGPSWSLAVILFCSISVSQGRFKMMADLSFTKDIICLSLFKNYLNISRNGISKTELLTQHLILLVCIDIGQRRHPGKLEIAYIATVPEIIELIYCSYGNIFRRNNEIFIFKIFLCEWRCYQIFCLN